MLIAMSALGEQSKRYSANADVESYGLERTAINLRSSVSHNVRYITHKSARRQLLPRWHDFDFVTRAVSLRSKPPSEVNCGMLLLLPISPGPIEKCRDLDRGIWARTSLRELYAYVMRAAFTLDATTRNLRDSLARIPIDKLQRSCQSPHHGSNAIAPDRSSWTSSHPSHRS